MVTIELTLEQAAALGYILDESKVEKKMITAIRRQHGMAVLEYYDRKRNPIKA